MNNVVLTEEEFKNAYNARVYLLYAIEDMESMLAAPLLDKLKKVQALLNTALERPLKERDEEHDRRYSHYESYRGDKGSVWSMYEVAFLEQHHPFYTATDLEYQGLSKDISHCKTWLDLWEVADELMTESEDGHHIFIEGFHPVKDGTVLELQTGS